MNSLDIKRLKFFQAVEWNQRCVKPVDIQVISKAIWDQLSVENSNGGCIKLDFQSWAYSLNIHHISQFFK